MSASMDLVTDMTPTTEAQEESSWLDKRTPTGQDVENAHRPLDPSFVQYFKHELTNSNAYGFVCEYLNDETELLLCSRPSSPARLSYPLSLASAMPEPMQISELECHVETFRSRAHSALAVIADIPTRAFEGSHLPHYLVLAMACIGSVTSGRPMNEAKTLWSSANTLVATTLEIDNTEARRLHLIDAGVLLEIYGALCAESIVWQQVEITHGYVQTAARRLCQYGFNDPSQETQSIVENSLSSHGWATMHCMLMVDVLRSIHYGSVLTLSAFEVLAHEPYRNGGPFHIYKLTTLEGCLPPPAEPIGSYLVALFAILADIHVLNSTFYPLIGSPHRESRDSQRQSQTAVRDFVSPYVPFSITNEHRLVRNKLRRALELWGKSYLALASTEVLVLYHFSHLYLGVGSMQDLPILAGYSPRLSSGEFTGTRPPMHTIDIETIQMSEAGDNAWLILEHIKHDAVMTPTWYPIAVFWAGLVVWYNLRSQVRGRAGGSRKVLLLFRDELLKMTWPCCEEMANTIYALCR